MQTLIHYIQHGWPMKDGMVFKGQQAVAPVILCKTILQSIHDSDSGIVKCIERENNRSTGWVC